MNYVLKVEKWYVYEVGEKDFPLICIRSMISEYWKFSRQERKFEERKKKSEVGRKGENGRDKEE